VKRHGRLRRTRETLEIKFQKKSEKSFGGFEKVITFVAPLKGKRVLAETRDFERRLASKNIRKVDGRH
jgi:hypothetical protein